MAKFHLPTKIVFGILGAMLAAAAIVVFVMRDDFKKPPAAEPEIVVSSPKAEEEILSPVRITGRANSSWFFEAVFPVQVLDQDGSVLGEGRATAQGDWMSEGPVDFTAIVQFKNPSGKTGTLLFKNDNPSGLTQNKKEFRLPVKFAQTTSANPPGTCAPDLADCGGNPELCLKENKNLVCE